MWPEPSPRGSSPEDAPGPSDALRWRSPQYRPTAPTSSKRRSGRSLRRKCYGCHGAKLQMAGLNLSGTSAERRWSCKGDAGTEPSVSAPSATTGKMKMPPSGKLAADGHRRAEEWIENGAPWPKDACRRSAALGGKRTITERIASTGRFNRFAIRRPNVKKEAWVKSPIDRLHPGETGRERNRSPRRPRRS